jgi:hypothetical protein
MTTNRNRLRQAFALEEALGILARTPAALDALLRDLPPHWITAHEGGETWSPFDVIGHLVHGERTDWVARVRIILEHGESKPFPPVNRAAQFETNQGRTIESLLAEFAALRRESLASVAAMPLRAEDLDRTGQHPSFGTVTLRQLLATWVAHDLDHIVQITRTLAKQYSDEVGPWRAYLGVIHRQP